MRIIYASWTYLETLEVPDDMTPDEIEELLDTREPERGTWNDREWGYQDGNWYR